MSIVATASTLTITLPTWVWAIAGVLLVLGLINMAARRGRF